MKRIILFLLLIPVFIYAQPLFSPTWGFRIELPQGYEYTEGDGKDRFSFSGPNGAKFDIIVYNDVYENMRELVNDINRRLSNQGNVDFFTYKNKQAAIIELNFSGFTGYGLCFELTANQTGSRPPMLLALAYGPAEETVLGLFHLSALDSIVPSAEELFFPGPIMEYGYHRGEAKRLAIGETGVTAMIRENDAELAQILIEREFNVLRHYVDSPNWQEAWIRYYRMVFRDSVDRITNAASALVQHLDGNILTTDNAKRAFAQRALTHIQGFKYERDFSGSDFLNLVSAITESRGDCDSRAMLWAIILGHADIRAAMMVSRHYGHAMGLADIAGAGARFEAHGTRWLVAETTDRVDIGLIAQDVSETRYWLGIIFE
jgi:hypothetical protein